MDRTTTFSTVAVALNILDQQHRGPVRHRAVTHSWVHVHLCASVYTRGMGGTASGPSVHRAACETSTPLAVTFGSPAGASQGLNPLEAGKEPG